MFFAAHPASEASIGLTSSGHMPAMGIPAARASAANARNAFEGAVVDLKEVAPSSCKYPTAASLLAVETARHPATSMPPSSGTVR